MARQTMGEKLTATKEGMRLYEQERAILEVTELICRLLDENQVSRTELARRLGKTKGYITQFLDGRTNMTLRTISDVFVALDRAVHFSEGPLAVGMPQQAEDSWVIRLPYHSRSQWSTTQEIGPIPRKGDGPQRLTA